FSFANFLQPFFEENLCLHPKTLDIRNVRKVREVREVRKIGMFGKSGDRKIGRSEVREDEQA
ncbi:hypothetical protein, partial [Flavobacterium sp.]|uniref:hypothetical protein n=1 Tax=Flavobacterium sp. TaxID=239 RepID=UPI002607890C